VRLPFNRQQRPRNTTTHAETRTRTAHSKAPHTNPSPHLSPHTHLQTVSLIPNRWMFPELNLTHSILQSKPAVRLSTQPPFTLH
jgi:hypothetical protein